MVHVVLVQIRDASATSGDDSVCVLRVCMDTNVFVTVRMRHFTTVVVGGESNVAKERVQSAITFIKYPFFPLGSKLSI